MCWLSGRICPGAWGWPESRSKPRRKEIMPQKRPSFLIHLLFNVLKFIMKVCEKQGRIKYGRKSRNPGSRNSWAEIKRDTRLHFIWRGLQSWSPFLLPGRNGGFSDGQLHGARGCGRRGTYDPAQVHRAVHLHRHQRFRVGPGGQTTGERRTSTEPTRCS